MYYFFCAWLFVCVPFSAIPQNNLVLNSSFEEHGYCSSGLSDVGSLLPYWTRISNTPDYYNICNQINASVPENFFGYQKPNTGNAYIGMVFLNIRPNIQQNRELIQGTLSQPLKSGSKYNLKSFFSLSDSSNYGCNKLGFLFSQTPISQIIGVPTYSPQIELDTLIIDKTEWSFVSSSFIADGGEQYIIIGNFSAFENCDVFYTAGGINIQGITNWDIAYYYIDNVSVVEDTSYHPTGIEEEQLKRLSLSYAGGSLHLQGLLFEKQVTQLQLYTLEGKSAAVLTTQPGTTEVPLEGLPQGVYLYEVRYNNASVKRGKISLSP